MGRQVIISLLFIFLCSFSIASLSTPNAFEGKIIVNDGTNPDGNILLGYIDGVATGETIINGNDFEMVILNYGGSQEIIFKIGDEESFESFSFESFKITDTNLTFATISNLGNNLCGNNVCDLNECSLCPIDCDFDDCLGNGECNVEVGESCALSPGDCGECISCSDNIQNGDETGVDCGGSCSACGGDNDGDDNSGSSSNSGGGGSGTPTTKDNTSGSSLDDLDGLGIQHLNSPRNNTTNNNFTSLFTGAFLGASGEVWTGIGIFALIVILAIIAYWFFNRN